MSKLILLLSLLGIALLFSLGLTNPDNPMVWLASASMEFAWLRLGMMIALASLLVTNPPRNVYLRMVVGAFASVLATWSLWETYNNQMLFLDSLSILLFSVSAGLTVLESDILPAETDDERLETARQARRLLNA
jgi:hypothetical protein